MSHNGASTVSETAVTTALPAIAVVTPTGGGDAATTGSGETTAASAGSTETTDASTSVATPAAKAGPRGRLLVQTARLDPRDLKPSWPIAIASLEQLSGWAVFALRLGTLALIQACVRELSEPDAKAELVVRLRGLTEALAHMPLEA
jgi:hypothetical protein